jgi:hypothetical protein
MSRLTHEQCKAVQMYLDGSDTLQISLLLSKDQTTIRRWSKLPQFVALLNEGRSVALTDAGLRLSKTAYNAATVLEDVMLDEETKPDIKIKAATSILDYALKLTDAIDHTQRLNEIEKVLNLGAQDE